MSINKLRIMKISIYSLGIINILAGLALGIIFILMQGFYLFLFGFFYIIFGIGLMTRKFYSKLLFYGIIPVTCLFSITITMSGIDKDIPVYCQIPLKVGILLILPFLIICFVNVYINTRRNVKRYLSGTFDGAIATSEKKTEIKKSLKWYEYVWSAWHLLIIFFSGVIGGTLGVIATCLNIAIFRSQLNKFLKFIVTLLISLSIVIAWLILVI